MSYSLFRNILFMFSPETAHELSLDLLSAAHRVGLLQGLIKQPLSQPTKVMGIEFPNPVGLAAGLDKNAEHIDAFSALGFGFVEVGTVTPLAQPGNPLPRLFRLKEHEAIINRMGFNNKGLDYVVEKVRNRKSQVPLGINVGKNFSTPVENAASDYIKGIVAAYPLADYITINVSSPNTPGLRSLQFGDSMKQLLSAVKEEQIRQTAICDRYVPIAVKIAPDLTDDEIDLVTAQLLEFEMDGVIATNTTVSRELVKKHPLSQEAGGLSGAPLRKASTAVVRALHDRLGENIPIIAVGGIYDGESAIEKMEAGAKLVQIYTGFIYKGPKLIKQVADAVFEYKVRNTNRL
ncbi:MAG: quinone-dependent dihydroorotate dehydrogenase [Hahellaceae bacterium]|nr:quinone-dependent dihydroorotate dehydrogenase [Hahellaceae bacterium]MCP5211958.1 quinone-dependent dihydroorotate dehydrogenase [Hahellaceae bacterium]